MNGTSHYRPFAPRHASRGPIRTIGDFQLKEYRIVYGAKPFEASRFTDAPRLLQTALPALSVESGRPGVGFCIAHQGLTLDYFVLAWWDRENELPIRVWVREASGWRAAREGESICVWDLEVIWFERNAWVETGLSGQPLAETLGRYLDRWFVP